jgi:hypothetical protein
MMAGNTTNSLFKQLLQIKHITRRIPRRMKKLEENVQRNILNPGNTGLLM